MVCLLGIAFCVVHLKPLTGVICQMSNAFVTVAVTITLLIVTPLDPTKYRYESKYNILPNHLCICV